LVTSKWVLIRTPYKCKLNQIIMKNLLIILFVSISCSIFAQAEKAVPIFKDGEAQIIPAFEDSEKWVRHDLWVGNRI